MSPTAVGDPARLVNFEHVVNFRDLGDIKTTSGRGIKPNTWYRSARPDCASPRDVDRLINDFKLKTIVDLRSAKEARKQSGSKLLEDIADVYVVSFPQDGTMRDDTPTWQARTPSTHLNRARSLRKYHIEFCGGVYARESVWRQLGLRDKAHVLYNLACDLTNRALWGEHSEHAILYVGKNVMALRELKDEYVAFLQHCRPAILRVLRLFLEHTDGAFLVHCAHGKDRTGVIVALILSCLGVSQEDIIADYALTETGLASWKEQTLDDFSSKGLSLQWAGSPPENMRHLLNHIKVQWSVCHVTARIVGLRNECWCFRCLF
eukprot:Colp12_sorted_trinity150504_noHs@25617